MVRAYTINDEVDLFIKHSTTPKMIAGGGEGRSWSFVFGPDQLRQMGSSRARGGVYVALVGASRQLKDALGCVCLLRPEQVREVLDFGSSSQQTLTVELVRGRNLRVYKDGKERFRVPQNSLENWAVPGASARDRAT